MLIFGTYLSDLRIIELPEVLVRWRLVGRSDSTNMVYGDNNKTQLQNYLMDEKCAWWVLTSFRQHLIDLWSLDQPRPDWERALHTRIAEIGLAHRLWRIERPEYEMLFDAIRGGTRPWPVIKLFLKFRYIGTYLALIEEMAMAEASIGYRFRFPRSKAPSALWVASTTAA